MRRPSSRSRLLVVVGVFALLGSGLVAPSPAAALPACPAPTTSSGTSTTGGVARAYTVAVITATSDCDWTVPAGVTSVDLLIVGGGGGGGGGVFDVGGGGGGGGGQVVTTTASVEESDVLSIDVGTGGFAGVGGPAIGQSTAGVTAGSAGAGSSVTTPATVLTAAGGAGGGIHTASTAYDMAGDGGTSGDGHVGGASFYDGGGGGGGASAAGGGGSDLGGIGADGGVGGAGVQSDLSGTMQWYAAGGGGGGQYVYPYSGTPWPGTGGAGGSGIGGNGTVNNGSIACGTPATAGAANTGSGGGGGGGVPDPTCWGVDANSQRANGGAGAAGVVVLRYALGPDMTGASVSGTPEEGQVLAATPSGVTGSPTPSVTYQWQTSANGTSGWSSISAATSSTYTATMQDVGQYLRAEVTATNADGSAVTTTTALGPVTAAPAPTPTPSPSPTSTPAPTTAPRPTSSPTPAPVVTPTSQVVPTAAPSARPVELRPGSATMLVGTESVPVERTSNPSTGGFALSAGQVEVAAAPQGTGFASGSGVVVSATGYAPSSTVNVFLFSEPTFLGTLPVGSDGLVQGTVAIPASVPAGQHTIQFTGWLDASTPSVLSTSITVAPKRATTMTHRIVFPFRSAAITPTAQRAITSVVTRAKAMRTPQTTVVGYVRAAGATDTDDALARSRAKAVAARLRAEGMPGVVRVGALKPTTEHTAKARKVVVTVTGS